MLLLMVAFDLSALVRYITRFTEESFAILIALIFIIEAFKKLIHIVDEVPVNLHPDIPLDYNCTCLPPVVNQDNSSLSLTTHSSLGNSSLSLTTLSSLGNSSLSLTTHSSLGIYSFHTRLLLFIISCFQFAVLACCNYKRVKSSSLSLESDKLTIIQ